MPLKPDCEVFFRVKILFNEQRLAILSKRLEDEPRLPSCERERWSGKFEDVYDGRSMTDPFRPTGENFGVGGMLLGKRPKVARGDDRGGWAAAGEAKDPADTDE